MTTPIEMPAPLPVNSKKFDLTQNQLITPIGGGFMQTIERARPYWVAEYTTPPLGDIRYNNMQAFLDELEGAITPFLGYDPRRPVPWAYKGQPIGGLSWPDAVATTADFAASTLTVNFGKSTIITKGDYIQVTIDLKVYLFRAFKSYAAGSTVTMEVRPRPNNFASVAHPVRLVRASAAMKMIGVPQWTDSVDTFPSVTFRAVQFIDRTIEV